MKIFDKVKTIKKKWLYLIVALVVVIAAGGVTAKVVHEKFRGQYGGNTAVAQYQTYYNLLRLENSTDMKITTEQAKALLPLVEKLSTTASTVQQDLIKSIYAQLTPQQYYALLNGENQLGNVRGPDNKRGNRGEFKGREQRDMGRGKMTIMDDATRNVVINMLKDKSTK